MNCLAQRKRFKNKHAAWEDPSDQQLAEPNNVIADEEQDKHGSEDSASSSDDDDDYELVAGEVRSKKIRLETKELRYKHLTNINNDRSQHGAVKQVQFHPTSRMAFVTLSRGQMDLFEVDGERNRYIQNIKLPFCKEPYCSFTPDGKSILISSDNYRGKFFYYDMVSGSIRNHSIKVGRTEKDMTDFRIHGDHMACRKEGSTEILMLSSKTYENTFTLKLNEPAKAVRFTNRDEIFIAGANANVYIWDVRKPNQCKHRFQDEGSVHTSSFDLSDTCKSLSIGSDCGIVNTYELDNCLSGRFPRPARTYANLKTPVDLLEYNHSGELLLFGSSEQSDAIRLCHTISGTVYRNFPVPRKDYGRISSACFSPLGGYLALGSLRGRAFLCRIPYYKAY